MMYSNAALAPLMNILENAIAFAAEEPARKKHREKSIRALEQRIAFLDEQIAAKTRTPPELQDAYREAIDAATLENTILSEQLYEAQTDLARTQTAHRAEEEHARMLEEKLNSLEARLRGLLRQT